MPPLGEAPNNDSSLTLSDGPMESLKQTHDSWISTEFGRHDPKGELPLAGYAALVGVFGTAMGLTLLAGDARRMRLPTKDILLFGVGTFQLSRIVAKDRVISPFRAPFTEYQKSAGAGEVDDTPRGEGLRHALGELLTCPYCLGPWLAGGLAITALRAPRRVRWLASIFAIVAIADVCQQGYAALKRLSK